MRACPGLSLLLMFVILGGCATPSPTASQPSGTAGEFLQSATALVQQGDWGGAIADATKALEINPGLALAYVTRSVARRQQGDAGAMADVTKAVEISPRLPRDYVIRSFARLQQGDLAAAIADATRALEINPQYAPAYAVRGLVRGQQRDPAGSIADATKALEINPQDLQAYNVRGLARLEQRDRPGALADATRALEVNPRLAWAYYIRGFVRMQEGDLSRAIGDTTQALKIDPRYALAYFTRSMARREQGDQAGAIADATKAAEERALTRPILYLDVEGTGRGRELVTRSVHPEGRQADVLVRTIGVVWSPDGNEFAYVSWRGAALRLGDPRTRTAKTVFMADTGETIYHWKPAFSPDGRRIAVLTLRPSERRGPSVVAVADVRAQRLLSRHPLPEGTVDLPYYLIAPNAFRWSPDGRKILMSWEKAVVIDLAGEAIETISAKPIIAEWAPGSDAVYYFDFDFDSRGLAMKAKGFYLKKLGVPGPIKLMDSEHLVAAGFTPGRLLIRSSMVLSPSASKLVVSIGSMQAGNGGDGMLQIYDLKGGAPVALDKPSYSIPTQDLITGVEWSPDENSLAVVAVREDVKIKSVDLATGTWRTLAKVALPLTVPEMDVLWFKILSWTQ